MVDISDDDDPAENKEVVTPESVKARVEDWEQRVNNLYSDIRLWAGENNWNVNEINNTPKHEDLMKKFGVRPWKIPILEISSERCTAFFKPRGLWIIGGNGRIDLHTNGKTYILVDRSDYKQASNWTCFTHDNKSKGTKFEAKMIEELCR